MVRVMSVYSIWPYFVCMVALLAIAATPILKLADTPPNPRGVRLSALDGLRGFLALGVFFHHAAIYHDRLVDGSWKLPPSDFYTLLGQVGVAVFFMITGYLFWDRVVRTEGRPDWISLFVGRLFRIGPLYLFATVTMLAIVFLHTGAHLNVTATRLAEQIGRWLMLGFILGPDNVNGFSGAAIVLTGTWTLHYEWLFYLALPLIALAARSAGAHLRFTVAGLAICLIYVALFAAPSTGAPPSVCALLFFIGMTCASLKRSGVNFTPPDNVSSLVVIALLVAVFTMFSTANRAAPALMLGFAFYLIVSGCTVFGLLTLRPARRLGDISYGVYLLQGLVFAIAFSSEYVRALALASALQHWIVVFGCAVALIGIATVTHALVERTGIDFGKRVSDMFAAWRRTEARAS
jgi:peptidoglycan/LPS O-acetylase OafA/YrhL